MACGATLSSYKRNLEFEPIQSAKRRCLPVSKGVTVKHAQPKPSAFGHATPKLTNEQITLRINHELKRLQHQRRRTHLSNSSPPLTPLVGSSSSHKTASLSSSATSLLSSVVSASHTSSSAAAAAGHSLDSPVLSLRQVGLVCERMIHEREEQIREEYDKILSDKLSEQYEAFLKFNHDQLHRRFGETAASYVS